VLLKQTLHAIHGISPGNLYILPKLYFSVKYVENLYIRVRDEPVLTNIVFGI